MGRPIYAILFCETIWFLLVLFLQLMLFPYVICDCYRTLSPMNSFSSELGVQFGTCLEAPHVIDVESQVLTM